MYSDRSDHILWGGYKGKLLCIGSIANPSEVQMFLPDGLDLVSGKAISSRAMNMDDDEYTVAGGGMVRWPHGLWRQMVYAAQWLLWHVGQQLGCL